MDFVAIDVETANADMASICQVGLVRFCGCASQDEWKSYIDPEDFFDAMNVSIHGIDESTVAGAPKLPEVVQYLNRTMDNAIAVCHTHFDRVAVHQAFARYRLAPPAWTWLDSARVARRAWSQFASSGYGLKNLSEFLGFEFQHHDALEDAKAAGHILLAAMEETGLSVEGWLKRVDQPIDPSRASYVKAIAREGNPEGPLHGEVMVFTGALQIPRCEAADLADGIGCKVAPGVTRYTTILVVGDQDVRRLAGHRKSSKHRKAESLIERGQPIRIVRESDFMQLVETWRRDSTANTST